MSFNVWQSYSQLRILYLNIHTSPFNSRWFYSVILRVFFFFIAKASATVSVRDWQKYPIPDSQYHFFFHQDLFKHEEKYKILKYQEPVIFMHLNIVSITMYLNHIGGRLSKVWSCFELEVGASFSENGQNLSLGWSWFFQISEDSLLFFSSLNTNSIDPQIACCFEICSCSSIFLFIWILQCGGGKYFTKLWNSLYYKCILLCSWSSTFALHKS